MITAQYFRSYNAIDDRWIQSIRCNEIVQTPANILAARIVSVRPKCVRFLHARIQITECISEAKRQQVGHAVSFLLCESGIFRIRFGISQICIDGTNERRMRCIKIKRRYG